MVPLMIESRGRFVQSDGGATDARGLPPELAACACPLKIYLSGARIVVLLCRVFL